MLICSKWSSSNHWRMTNVFVQKLVGWNPVYLKSLTQSRTQQNTNGPMLLRFVFCLLPIAYCQSSVVCFSFVSCLSTTVNCPLSLVHCLLSIVSSLWSMVYGLWSIVNCLLPIVYGLLPVWPAVWNCKGTSRFKEKSDWDSDTKETWAAMQSSTHHTESEGICTSLSIYIHTYIHIYIYTCMYIQDMCSTKHEV